jgi:hypothetical protein
MVEANDVEPPSPGPLRAGNTSRRVPRWVIPFLRALERTGDARAAAVDAGIDHTTAYARRKAHGEFAQAWAEALRGHEEAKARAEAEEIEAVRQAPPPHSVRSPTPSELGEDLVVSNGQVKRAGPGRWNKAKEKIFFEELAATANARAAADAIGMSKNAVLQRKRRHPLFAAKWEAVVENARAGIDLYLVEAANQTFDPDELDTGDVAPKVTIDQAIKISQMNARKAKAQEELLPDPYAEQAASMTPDDVHQLRERLVRKLQAIRRRDRPALLAQGWSYDEEYDREIPPGWVRAAI